MKIIEHPKKWYHEFTCTTCEARWGAEATDIKRNPNYVEDRYGLRCSWCGTFHHPLIIPAYALAVAKENERKNKDIPDAIFPGG